MNKKNLLRMIGGVLLLILATVAGTYAYFTANITTPEEATTLTVTGGTMNIVYSSPNKINVAAAFPRTSALDTKSFTVTGTNTTGANMYYNLSLVVESNGFPDGALAFSLSGSKTEPTGTLASNITKESISSGAQIIPLGKGSYVGAGSSIVHSYTLSLYYPNKEGVIQNSEQGKQFKGHIGVEAVNS